MAASIAEVKREMNRRKLEKGHEQTEGPGVLASMWRGLGQSDAFRVHVSDDKVPEKAGFYSPDVMSQKRYDELRKEHFRHEPNAPLAAAPVTGAERVAEGVGRALPYVAGGAVAAPLMAPAGMSGATAVALEMALGTGGTAVAETVREQGGSAPSQMGAELLATAAAPLAVPSRIAKKVGKAASRGMSSAARSAAEGIATKYGVSVEAAFQASSELKRKLARGTKDPEKYIDKARERLGEDIETFGEGTTPSLSQSIDEYGGQNISSMELNYARGDQDYASDALGRRLDLQEELGAKHAQITPDGTLGGAQEAYATARKEAQTAERAAWDAVPFDDMPDVPTAGLKRAVAELRKRKFGKKYLPNEADEIEALGDMASVKDIQALRSELLDTQRAGLKPTASDIERRSGARVRPILDEVQKILDNLPDDGGELYQAARSMTKANRAKFNMKDKGTAALVERTEGASIVRQIKGAKDPTGEAKRLVSVLKDQDGGLNGIQSVFFDDLFGEMLGSKTAKQMQKSIDGRRGVYREVFGEEGLGFIEEVVRRHRTIRTGKAGTTAQSLGTGTGQSAIVQLMSAAHGASNPIWLATTSTAKFLANKSMSRQEMVTLIRLASQDIRLGKALLDLPTKRAEPAWRLILEQGFNRAKRETTKVAGRNIRRIGGDSPQGVTE